MPHQRCLSLLQKRESLWLLVSHTQFTNLRPRGKDTSSSPVPSGVGQEQSLLTRTGDHLGG